ncbi:MAG: SusD/RagB family nutrient-binding outer membrane lipoprotein [Ginsengibacter sp.]
MKKIFLIIAIVGVAGLSSCTKKQLADDYTDPSKVSSTTVEKQFAGFLSANLGYAMYQYWNYFVVLQNTMLPWTQTVGIINSPGRYVPGAAAIDTRWSNYYASMAQYKELLRLYSTLSTADQADKRIYIIAATIYFYDQTQKTVDLYGSIPWSNAGLLGTNGGDYVKSTPTYDDPSTIYTTMLDDLKGFSDELNTISLKTGVATVINTQDFINHGDLTKWKKYCNSLRMRMLTRVSGVASFQSRVSSEIAAMLANPSNYPLVLTNADNILISVTDPTTGVSNGSGTGSGASFHTGLIGWGGGDISGKVMVDFMNNNADPRLRTIFAPGDSAKPAGTYTGLDPSLGNTPATDLVNSGKLARYNRSTLSQNIYVPGMIINAAEVNFLLSEYYLNAGNDASAKSTYEAGINQSVDYYYYLRTISNDNTDMLSLKPPAPAEKSAYIASSGVAWATAATTAEKLNRIATQKWINYNVLEPDENWAEIRRLKLPALVFVADNSGLASLPPNRWVLPSNEITYNSTNYEAVAANDKLSTKIFWDIK